MAFTAHLSSPTQKARGKKQIMDFQLLNQRLQELGVKPKDDLRASLYIDHLERIKIYFTKIYSFKNSNYGFVEKAVTAQSLLNELAQVLDSFVAPAVAVDLARAYETVPKGGLGHGGA